MHSNNCYFSTCRFNKKNECTNKDRYEECMCAVQGVLGESYNEFIEWKKQKYADFGNYMNEPE